MPTRGPATLICAATGTGLSKVTKRLTQGVVLDLEHIICKSYEGDPALAVDPGEIPTMDQVARRPRSELYERWNAAAEAAAAEIAAVEGEGPRVLGMHLSWYNSTTSEFFFPAIADPLRGGGFERVVVLIDDVYDMLARLEDGDDIYAGGPQSKRAKQLRRLGFQGLPDADGKRAFAAGEEELTSLHAAGRARYAAFAHLLGWRRAEMLRAETLARELGVSICEN